MNEPATPPIDQSHEPEPGALRIEKLVYGGDGLARQNGQIVLLPFVLPGELVRAETRPAKGATLRGEVAELIEPSAERVAPPCPYFADCGGCHYQHAGYRYQLELKGAILRETLQRLGGIHLEVPLRVSSAEPWGYRNRIQLHFSRRKLGFRRAHSHDLCEVDSCPVASPRLNQVLSALKEAARRPEWPEFLDVLEVFTNENDVQLNIVQSKRPVAARFFDFCAKAVPGFLPGPLEYPAAGHTFRIGRGSFFQVNRFLIDSLVEEVLGGVDALGSETPVIDLYAGVGLFTLPLAKRFADVTAVERSAPAFRDLEWNCAAAGAAIQPVQAATEDFLHQMQAPAGLVIADPPRTGLGKAVTDELVRLPARRLVVVSCDPATLARDLKGLSAAYRIDRASLVDLFPQTYHFETVVHLTSRDEGYSN
jgi:23S rRNA (uracil1939-C5)-methyltransferase